MTASSITIATTLEEARRLRSFQEDQERARQRVHLLEEQARVFIAAGKVVPASANLRTARLIKYLWCLEGNEIPI